MHRYRARFRARFGGDGGRRPQPGDYLVDQDHAYLTDESGNRLTA